MHECFSKLISNAEHVGFFGVGESNRSLIAMLPEGISITLRSDVVIDKGSIPNGLNIKEIYEEKSALCNIEESVIFLSPSVRCDRPELIAAEARGTILSSDCELFFKAANAPVLAVSGSSGKSTTAYLTALLINGAPDNSSADLAAKLSKNVSTNDSRNPIYTRYKGDFTLPHSEHRAVLCGNIGKPMLESVCSDAKVYVAELSSFMLMNHKATVHRSAITNITKNHLDWHKSFEEYKKAKLSLLSLSSEIVINADDKILSQFVGKNRRIHGIFSTRLSLSELVKRHKSKLYYTLENSYICRNGEKIIDTGDLIRTEEHNIANMMCAMLLSDGYAQRSRAQKILSSFRGLPHRCETIAFSGGVRYINSSIDTSAERTSATLAAFSENVILLLGGHGKGLSYEPIISAAQGKVKSVITFGEEGEKIANLLRAHFKTEFSGSFKDAVIKACCVAQEGDTVLLSPACTSYDEFSSFEQRGKKFEEIVFRTTGENSE